MCLIYKQDTTERLRDAMRQEGGSLTLWKRLEFFTNKLVAPHFATEYKPGENAARDGLGNEMLTPPPLDPDDDEVGCGIHVYLNRSDADAYVGLYEVVVPVTCRIEHLIAAGTNNGETDGAVFTRVTISQEDYDAALKDRVRDEYHDDWDDDDDDWDDEDDDDDWDDDWDDNDEDDEDWDDDIDDD